MGGGPESRCVGRVYGLDGAVGVQPHAPTTLSPRKNPRYPHNKRLSGPHSRFGSFREKGKYLAPAGSRTEDRPVCSLVNTDYAIADPGTLTVNTKMYTGFVRYQLSGKKPHIQVRLGHIKIPRVHSAVLLQNYMTLSFIAYVSGGRPCLARKASIF